MSPKTKTLTLKNTSLRVGDALNHDGGRWVVEATTSHRMTAGDVQREEDFGETGAWEVGDSRDTLTLRQVPGGPVVDPEVVAYRVRQRVQGLLEHTADPQPAGLVEIRRIYNQYHDETVLVDAATRRVWVDYGYDYENRYARTSTATLDPTTYAEYVAACAV